MKFTIIMFVKKGNYRKTPAISEIDRGGKRMEMMRNKNVWVIPAYGIFYLITFFLLENSQVSHHMIHCALDDRIPFCEYFIVPYFMWFGFIAATVVYFLAFNESSKEYSRLIATLGTGMTMFLIISFVYPNSQNLRPDLHQESGNIFIAAVKFLYMIDTPTNIFPSIHVFNTLACMGAIVNNERCRRHKGVIAGTGLLSTAIILSTLFLKQHSMIDVISAFICYTVCYFVFYRFIPENETALAQILRADQILTIPNVLSMFRLVLAIVFWGIGLRKVFPGKQMILVGILVVSGITDFLDGKIARKYGMVSEFGKILDPIADKVTQGVLLLHLVNQYPLIQITLMLFLVKEASMAIASSRLLIETHKNDGAVWYGKVSTAVFYVVMIVLVLFPEIPLRTANGLIAISSFCMAGAFVMYMNRYAADYQAAREKFRPAGFN